ncbi:A24 family peptidase [Paraburkholderia phytofirmans]|uniref:A24 family peptidase n=1 Tax=Paraburkholderia phytofirmans TaxID=261302 RepID=UPI0009ED74A7|nr:prepilin peptidase [Paraburkholderia phytofirmans]
MFSGAVLIVSPLSIAIRLVVFCALLWLAVFDVRCRRLPSRMILMIGALFFINAVVIRMPIGDVLAHLLLAFAVLVVCAALFAANVLGGGDAKLASIVFLWLGRSLALPALTLISVIGLGVSLISLATRHMNPKQNSPSMRTLAMFSGARGVPYGVALALGGGSLIVLPSVLPLLSMR